MAVVGEGLIPVLTAGAGAGAGAGAEEGVDEELSAPTSQSKER